MLPDGNWMFMDFFLLYASQASDEPLWMLLFLSYCFPCTRVWEGIGKREELIACAVLGGSLL